VSASDSAGVRFPPPFIYLIALVLGIFGGRLLPGALPRGPWLVVIGSVFFLAGLALAGSAIGLFRANRTNVNPNAPVTALVTSGPYRFTRNPMYVGLALVYLAVAIWTASLWACVLLVAVLIIIRYAVIAREERYMTAKFGDAYISFTSRVRRWF
jgi:protein-S-isoprenylcysteine O-methyltransferase Ste14